MFYVNNLPQRYKIIFKVATKNRKFFELYFKFKDSSAQYYITVQLYSTSLGF